MIHPAPKPKARRRKPVSRLVRSRPRARNETRHKREWIRAYHSEARVQFVASLPCLVCGVVPSVCAHVGKEGKGASRKADYDQTIPLCQAHHDELHQSGEIVRLDGPRTTMTFTAEGLAVCCAVIEKAWQEVSRG